MSTITLPASDSHIHPDVVAALGALPEIVATDEADAGQYRYKYASLAAIMRLVRPVLAEHHLALSQLVTSSDGMLSVTTLLVHSSGTFHQSGALRVELPRGPQAIGSLTSYLRRYQLVALLGLAIEDDDGRTGSAADAQRSAGSARGTSPARSAQLALTDPQRRRIMALFGELGMSGPEYRDERLALTADIIGRDIDTTNDVSRSEAPLIIEALEARVAQLEQGSYS